ncbi:MAG: FHA domain-containing protein, partial [Deltaproteobacteria bacterium]|nr:FHA domain-containing protein [Kofleriaceae bacterium]
RRSCSRCATWGRWTRSLAGRGPGSPRSSTPAMPGRALVASLDGREIARVTLDQDVIKIGRQPSAQLHLDDESVSRMHAVVEVTDGGAQIVDLGSARGTVHNGTRINKAALVAGDVLDLGEVRVEVVAVSGRGR